MSKEQMKVKTWISEYLKSYSVLEFLTEIVPICEAHLHHKASIIDTESPEYDLGVRIKQMDVVLLSFLNEFDLDLVVSSFIAQLRNKSDAMNEESSKDKQYGELAEFLNSGY